MDKAVETFNQRVSQERFCACSSLLANALGIRLKEIIETSREQDTGEVVEQMGRQRMLYQSSMNLAFLELMANPLVAMFSVLESHQGKLNVNSMKSSVRMPLITDLPLWHVYNMHWSIPPPHAAEPHRSHNNTCLGFIREALRAIRIALRPQVCIYLLYQVPYNGHTAFDLDVNGSKRINSINTLGPFAQKMNPKHQD
jgi:hypothetical protein